jgi:hypothetical protein
MLAALTAHSAAGGTNHEDVAAPLLAESIADMSLASPLDGVPDSGSGEAVVSGEIMVICLAVVLGCFAVVVAVALARRSASRAARTPPTEVQAIVIQSAESSPPSIHQLSVFRA